MAQSQLIESTAKCAMSASGKKAVEPNEFRLARTEALLHVSTRSEQTDSVDMKRTALYVSARIEPEAFH
jgi:hypothetical protein